MRSKSNEHEAKFIAALCKYLLMQGYKPQQITVLTPYTGQLMKLKRLMPKKQFEGVRLTAVDNFQGEENDIILLSLVRSNNEGKVGFLGEDNRVCVALSRAKKGFFVIGNIEFLAKHSVLWNKMKSSLEESNSIGPAMLLRCQNHPSDKGIRAGMAEDFEKAPEGGCSKPCEARLPCGHVCILACHSYDRDHKEYKCQKACNKVLCPLGHKCLKKCYIKCGDCKIPIPKVIPKCGHLQNVPCFQEPSTFTCQEKCKYKLDCEHECKNKCGEEHTKKCLTDVPHKFCDCGHEGNVRCYEKLANPKCTSKCQAVLDCEHKCKGSCSSCFSGFIHKECMEKCGRILVCGHECLSPCASNCPPCQRQCENQCIHSRCPQLCGIPCNPCREQCEWRCPHFVCKKLCFEPCDRPRCNKPCPKPLQCGHRCIGLCGEPCPDKCRICHCDEVKEIFFGNEDEPDAHFVQLEDCKHILEVAGLDHWMDQRDKEIKMKECPKCKTVIRRNLRYGTIIKQVLENVELVKKKLAGERKEIEEMKLLIYTKFGRLKAELEICDKLLSDNEATDLIEIIDKNLDKCEVMIEIGRQEFIIIFLSRLCKIWKQMVPGKRGASVAGLTDILNQVKVLFEWISQRLPKMTPQQAKEIDREIKRLAMLQQFVMLKDKLLKVFERDDIERDLLVSISRADSYFYSKKPLTERQEMEIEMTLKELDKKVPKSGLYISDEERKMIVKAMDMSLGHWFKCPNGKKL